MTEGATASTDHFVSRAPKLGYAGPLDGVRGIAVLMVLLAHANYTVFGSFAGSVDMFFVVSGFLIPTLILEEHRAEGRIDYRNFYTRRILRLFPVLYSTLLVTLVGGLLLGGTTCSARGNAKDALCHRFVYEDVAAAGTYVYHVIFPVHREVVKVGDAAPELRPLIHLWTLSVEEHFYLIVAVMMAVVITRKLVNPLIVAFVAAWVFIGGARLTGHVGPDFAWMQRPDSLMLGVVAAMVHAQLKPLAPRSERLLRWAATASAATIAVVIGIGTTFAPARIFVPFAPFNRTDAAYATGVYWPKFGFSVCGLGMAIIVFAMVRCPDHWLCRVFGMRWLREVGKRSYTIYVLHVPLFLLLMSALHVHLGVAEGAVAGLYLIALPVCTELVHRGIEKPALKLKNRFAHLGASGRT